MRLIEEASRQGSRQASACTNVGISSRTFQRWKKNPQGDQRRGPKTIPANKLSSEERARAISIAASARFRDQSPAQIVPHLADEGVYVASESTFYRILQEENMNAHRQSSKPPTHSKPKELVATGPNEVWSWDITYLYTQIAGLFYYLYLVMDIYSRKIVGFDLHDREHSDLSSEMIERLCEQEQISQDQLALHSDNGGPMKGATMLATLQRLGVMPSFSRPSVKDDNPFSESLFRTLKYCPFYPSKPFRSMDEAIRWIKRFIVWYNTEHLHSSINFVTPEDRHLGRDVAILTKRTNVYEEAKTRNPSRWSRHTRSWNRVTTVVLNPLQRRETSTMKKAA